MVPSNKALRKISKRIREGLRKEEDLISIESYRDSKLPDLLTSLAQISSMLHESGVEFLISGRPKRLKSIVRKLERTPGSNLATLIDLIGLRIIVSEISVQDEVTQKISEKYSVRDKKDYRERGLYRAIHLYIDRDSGPVEVQIRTLPQQLWANESESFGEKVKEGTYNPDQRAYLEELSRKCADLDENKAVDFFESKLGLNRGPIRGVFPNIQKNFRSAISLPDKVVNFLITFDGLTNELIKTQSFLKEEIESAIHEFCRLSKMLKQDRYDVLLLNANSISSLKVTHPVYFPII